VGGHEHGEPGSGPRCGFRVPPDFVLIRIAECKGNSGRAVVDGSAPRLGAHERARIADLTVSSATTRGVAIEVRP
jgi:hypothetical protein